MAFTFLLLLRDAGRRRQEPAGLRPDRRRRRAPHPEDGEGLRGEHKDEGDPLNARAED